MPTVTPFLWFDGDLREVVEHYRTIFPDLEVEGVGAASDPVYSASIRVYGQQLHLLNGGPAHANFTPAISLFISVETQEEIDRIWDGLLSGGGEPNQCGWLQDRFGLSWQVVPSNLGELLGSADRTRAGQAHEAMMGMVKLDMADLQAAYDR